MQKSLNISLLFFLLASSVMAQSENISVTIETNTNSALIYIDDSFIGIGNVNLVLAEGVHFVKIKASQREWDSQIIKDTLNIHSETGDISLQYRLEKLYYLDTNPQDATVYKNGNMVGHTPLFIKNGVEFVNLEKKDYKSLNLNLNEILSHKKVNMEFIGNRPKKSFVESPWFKVLLGTAVALGATTAHYKIQADKEYDKYIDTSDKKYLDQTDRYDLYSGLAFGALQINFGVLIYILLTE